MEADFNVSEQRNQGKFFLSMQVRVFAIWRIGMLDNDHRKYFGLEIL